MIEKRVAVYRTVFLGEFEFFRSVIDFILESLSCLEIARNLVGIQECQLIAFRNPIRFRKNVLAKDILHVRERDLHLNVGGFFRRVKSGFFIFHDFHIHGIRNKADRDCLENGIALFIPFTVVIVRKLKIVSRNGILELLLVDLNHLGVGFTVIHDLSESGCNLHHFVMLDLIREALRRRQGFGHFISCGLNHFLNHFFIDYGLFNNSRFFCLSCHGTIHPFFLCLFLVQSKNAHGRTGTILFLRERFSFRPCPSVRVRPSVSVRVRPSNRFTI